MTKRNIITWVLTIALFITSIVLFSITLVKYIPRAQEWEKTVDEYNKIAKDYDNGNGFLKDENGRITYCTVYGLTQTSYKKLSSVVYQSDGKSATVTDENLTVISEKISKMQFTATDETVSGETNSLTLNYTNSKSITLTYYKDIGIFEIDGNCYYATLRTNYFYLQETLFEPILV